MGVYLADRSSLRPPSPTGCAAKARLSRLLAALRSLAASCRLYVSERKFTGTACPPLHRSDAVPVPVGLEHTRDRPGYSLTSRRSLKALERVAKSVVPSERTPSAVPTSVGWDRHH